MTHRAGENILGREQALGTDEVPLPIIPMSGRTFLYSTESEDMLKSGEVLDLTPVGAKFFIKKTAADTDGRALEMEWELAPKSGGTPVHIHPDATETYEVLEGEFDVFVDGEWRTLGVGERVAVPPGVPHTFRNSTGGVVRVYNAHEPAMRFGEYFGALADLVQSGTVSSQRMTLKAILHLSLVMRRHEAEIISVKPPHFVMRTFARLARALGYRA